MRRISKKDKMNKRKRALLFGLEGGQVTVMDQRKEFIQEYLTREKLSSEEIQQQMKELGVEMEIVPLI